MTLFRDRSNDELLYESYMNDIIKNISSELSESWLEIAKKVVKEKQMVYINPKTLKTSEDKKRGFMVLDAMTANMLVTIADALSSINKEKFTKLPLLQAVNLGWKLIK